ncbi:MAG: glycosyltransferase family 4 protein, partial [Gammaproteobacteria bacterium]|nr:glycosyltransferase family 4 protein [Gammaproteobacteria bacterium]
LHSEFDIQAGHKVVGMVAQFIPRKGHRYLIEAAPHILEQRPDTCFLFLGQGRNMEELQSLCHKVGIAHKTKFAGFRPDLERILPCIDLIVHPATMEGLGVSLLQAAAAAVPIVATNVGGIPEIVHNGMNGYLVASGDSLMIAKRVQDLLQDTDKAHRFGVAGQSIVASHFTVEAMVSGNLKVYHEVL